MSTPGATNKKFGHDNTSLLILNQAINNSREVIILTDKKGVITFVNPQFTKLYGYTADEVVGKRTPRFLSREYINSDHDDEYWEDLQIKQSFYIFFRTNLKMTNL